jgi:hypothetical protein
VRADPLAAARRGAYFFAMAKTAPKATDARPPVAIGHVRFRTADVPAAAQWLAAAGLRPIAAGKSFAVLELRGGTHLVVSRVAKPPKTGAAAPFDLMVDDVDATHRAYARNGWKPGRIHRGRIHDSFAVAGPDCCRIEVLSSHAGRRAV